MKRLIITLLGLVSTPSLADQAGFLIQLGLTDKETTVWDGSIKVSPGEVAELAGWRFERTDALEGQNAWKASSRHAPAARKGRSNNPKKAGLAKKAAANLGPMHENGVFVRLDKVTPESVVEVMTKQGNFSFKIADVKDGDPLDLLEGRVAVQRTAVLGERISPERTDDDFPAIAVTKEGRTLVIYQSFTPGIDRDERAKRLESAPEDMSFLAKPAGGDQLWLHDGATRLAVTETGRDIYKSAIAIDGKGTAWIAWSERVQGNFDIFVRAYSDNQLGETSNLSNTAGNDVSPVACADAEGKVWIAWQGAKDTAFAIFAKQQTADGWGETKAISNNTGNCWQPAITAGAKGVAIAWDCYDKGDYDVWLWQSGDGKAQPVANSPLYEARPSLTYDKEGALWLAWEKSGPTWGKDWGAYDGQDGIGLYRDRQIGLAVLKEGQWMEPQGSVAEGLPGAPPRPGRKGKARGADATAPPPPAIPELADGVNADAYLQPAQRRGAPGEHAAAAGWGTYNNLGRLTTDVEGRIWLVARTRLNSFRGPVGSTWVNYATYLDGAEWFGPILLPHSDNLIYNLPALAATSGGVMVAHNTDHRMDRLGEFNQARDPRGKGGNAALDATKDPFDNDVYLSLLQAQNAAKPAVLRPATVKPFDNPQPSSRTVAERAEVEAMRNFRVTVRGTELRILRGEFHRHTEISGDGAGDGPLEDMWRYGIDAAAMDWIGNGDHDNGNGREYTWWLTQKTTDAFHLPGTFTPMFSYERSVSYPEGHRNCVFAQRGVRTLPRLPISDPRVFEPAPDTLMLYKYLHHFNGVCASHTSVGSMGTDWRNHDPVVEPMVEVYQGARQNYEYPGCPRCPTKEDAIGGWEPAGFINNAFAKGYKFSFQSSSDHGSTHISYAMIYAEEATREAILKAMQQRRTYGATDNIIADSRCTDAAGAERMMGEEFTVKGAPTLRVRLIGTAPFEKVTVIKNNVEIPLEAPKAKEVSLTWTDPQPDQGKESYYYVRGEQANGELVWLSPMWIKVE